MRRGGCLFFGRPTGLGVRKAIQSVADSGAAQPTWGPGPARFIPRIEI
eukprot:SAG31_NODE_28264_length_412_cov_2.418530_2_plen_47_part_01